MSENITRDRSWRVDLTKTATEHDSPSRISLSEPTGIAQTVAGNPITPLCASLSRTIREFRRWGRRFRGLVGTHRGEPETGETSVEAIVHDFAATVSSAIDPSVVASGLVQAAKRLTGTHRVELVFEAVTEANTNSLAAAKAPPPVEHDPSLMVSIDSGAQHWGVLRLFGMPAKPWDRRRTCPLARPLKTLCTLAAMAFDGITTTQLFDTLGSEEIDDADALIPAEVGPPNQSTPLLRDATYLHVILPYALNQARRHREPLSILYTSIDRLSAIHEMLGPDLVTRAVNQVGEIIVERLRSSDVVSRMEDDRILAMLPNATASDANQIADQIRLSVERLCVSLADLPPLTVSIGVASFPTHSKDVDSLLIATDEAIANAQAAGRNRVVVAEVPHRL